MTAPAGWWKKSGFRFLKNGHAHRTGLTSRGKMYVLYNPETY